MNERRTSIVRATYRSLLLRGLDPAEAANVTAFLSGLPVAGIHWTVSEVDQLVECRRGHLARIKPRLSDLVPAKPVTWQTS
jgi:hypothetical protein